MILHFEFYVSRETCLTAITGSAKRHILGLKAVAKVSDKPEIWIIASTKRALALM